ncbi:MAG: bacterial Ig-like domain-containing protein, partial [Clostridia bacterium]|nr:bacterial Ig-like domain-containing protein [Clostridia bacterium]
MKRIISAVLILIMLIPPMVLPAEAATLVQADSAVRITADKAVAAVGETVTVTVAFENIPACGAVDFNLVYDTEYLQAPAKSDVSMNIGGTVKDRNPAYSIDEKTSEEYAGRQAVKVVAAGDSNCLKGSSGTLFTVKFVVANEAPAPGIPLAFFGTFSDLYSNRDLRNTIQVFNTHIATAEPTKEVTAVSLKQAPTKTQYVQGQALNLEGGRLLVNYDDSSSQEVYLSLAQITQYDFTKLGTQTVKAEYAGKEVSFEIQTEASVLSSISVGQVPATVEYIQGKTAQLDRSEGVLLLHYTGGIVKTLEMSDAEVTLSGYDKDQLGVQKIKVQYGGFETEYKIAVVKKAISDIDVRTPMVCDACGSEWSAFDLIQAADASVDPYSMDFNERLTYIKNTANNVTCPSDTCAGATFSTKMKMVYFVGEDFDVGNAKLFVTYSGGTTEEIDMTLDMVEFKNSFATTQNVEVAYGAQWMLIKNVQTRKKEATAISVTRKPKTEYVKGQSFDRTGGIIHVEYNDGSEEDLPMEHEDVRVHYSGMDELGEHRVTVFYESQQAYFYIKVIARVVKSIAVDPEATSTYVRGQEPDPDTKLLVTYNDDETETAYLRNATVTGYNSEQIGLQVLTITYGGVNCNWPVTVEEPKVDRIEVIPLTDLEYVEGQELNLAGGKITAIYNDDSVVEDIPITSDMISGYDKTLLGE